MTKIARKNLFVDESRIWTIEEPAAGAASNMKTKIRSILLGYMWYDVHVESILNIRGSSRILATMGITEKNNFLREFSRYLQKNERHNFYSLQSGNWTFLYSALSRKLIFFFFFLVIKSGMFLYQNFSTIKRQNIFLDMLNMLENLGKIMFDVNIQKLKENITSIKNQLAVHQLNHF